MRIILSRDVLGVGVTVGEIVAVSVVAGEFDGIGDVGSILSTIWSKGDAVGNPVCVATEDAIASQGVSSKPIATRIRVRRISMEVVADLNCHDDVDGIRLQSTRRG